MGKITNYNIEVGSEGGLYYTADLAQNLTNEEKAMAFKLIECGIISNYNLDKEKKEIVYCKEIAKVDHEKIMAEITAEIEELQATIWEAFRFKKLVDIFK